jgi:predicted transcriptional regulator
VSSWQIRKRPLGIGLLPYRILEIALTAPLRISKLTAMVVHLKPETESRLQELAATTGRAPDELVEDAMTGYLAELTQVRAMLDGRYDDIKSGRVQPVDGEEAFGRLRQKS